MEILKQDEDRDEQMQKCVTTDHMRRNSSRGMAKMAK